MLCFSRGESTAMLRKQYCINAFKIQMGHGLLVVLLACQHLSK